MIPIQKSATVPAPLDGGESLGGKATQRLISAMEKGEELPAFQNGIYGDHVVKDQLILDQHDKCAYCERADVTANFHGDVEHFRPKAGWMQKPDETLNKPGYYWLAYEWTNLLFTCQHCNQVYKKNHFPLRSPKNRSHSHHDNIGRERPILIDPTHEDPSRSIEFREEVPVGIDTTGRGKRTIKILGLDRPKLNDSRRKLLNRIHEIQELFAAFDGKKLNTAQAAAFESCKAFLRECVKSNSEYAAMCRCAINASAG